MSLGLARNKRTISAEKEDINLRNAMTFQVEDLDPGVSAIQVGGLAKTPFEGSSQPAHRVQMGQ